nr:hypothetical protein SYMBAF_50182 [Serratia symbiotica]
MGTGEVLSRKESVIIPDTLGNVVSCHEKIVMLIILRPLDYCLILAALITRLYYDSVMIVK